MRIQLPHAAWLHSVDESLLTSLPDAMQSEIDAMQYVRETTSISLPKILHYDLDNRNSVRAAWIIMEAVYGRITPRVFSRVAPTLSGTNILSNPLKNYPIPKR